MSLQQVPQLSVFTLDFGANNLADNHGLTQQHNDTDTMPSFDSFNGGNLHLDENSAQELNAPW